MANTEGNVYTELEAINCILWIFWGPAGVFPSVQILFVYTLFPKTNWCSQDSSRASTNQQGVVSFLTSSGTHVERFRRPSGGGYEGAGANINQSCTATQWHAICCRSNTIWCKQSGLCVSCILWIAMETRCSFNDLKFSFITEPHARGEV